MSSLSSILTTSPLQRRVVITGMGAITPLGNNLKSSWDNLFPTATATTTKLSTNHHIKIQNPQQQQPYDFNLGITTLEQAIRAQNLPNEQLHQELEWISNLPCQVAAPVRNIEYDPRTSRFVQFALHAGWEAAHDAKLLDWLQVQEHNHHPNNNDKEEEEEEDKTIQSKIIQRRRERAGTSLGIGLSSLRDILSSSSSSSQQQQQTKLQPQRQLNRLSPHFVPKILPNSAPSRLSIQLKLQGPNHAISTACAASSHAIMDGIRCIQMGDADIMLVGGFESSIDPVSIAGFCRLRALSTQFHYHHHHKPSIDVSFVEELSLEDQTLIKTSSRPFDSKRDGFVMGEGGAILVLEELEHALYRKRNECPDLKILGEVIGYGTTGDAFHVTAPDTNGRGAERAMTMALERAALSRLMVSSPDSLPSPPSPPSPPPPPPPPSFSLTDQNVQNAFFQVKNDLQYINAHATSTPIGDDIEARVIQSTFFPSTQGEHIRDEKLYVSSTKGATGHLLGAAGAVEAAFTVLTLSNHQIPPTWNLLLSDEERQNEDEGFQHVTTTEKDCLLKKDVSLAMSNSLGFGGTNSSLIFAKY